MSPTCEVPLGIQIIKFLLHPGLNFIDFGHLAKPISHGHKMKNINHMFALKVNIFQIFKPKVFVRNNSVFQ